MSRCNESIKALSTTNYSEMLDRTGRNTAVNSSRELTATALCSSTTADKRTYPANRPPHSSASVFGRYRRRTIRVFASAPER